MFDYTREYAEFKNYVERIYTAPEEKARITEEFALFEQRGWQNYIVLLPKIIKQIERNARSSYSYSICDKDGTLYDSYAILKFIEVDFEHPS